jgi:CheY-like chemotaxis protein
MKKILVIEDSKDMRENIIDMLNEYGYSTFEADSGVSGLAGVKEVKPDLIIADIMMPGMDGFELLEALKKDHRTLSIPFIFLSAKAADSDIKRGLETDAELYITKPFKMNELLSHISDILN